MKLTILGTGTGVPSEARNSSSLLVQNSGRSILFESGPGTLKSLLKYKVDFLSLDYIFYTHLHLDHISDLAYILFAAKIPPTLRKKPLTIYGPKGLKAYYKDLRRLYKGTISSSNYRLTINELDNSSLKVAGLKITSQTLKHHGKSMGYKIESPDSTAVYTGDTDYCKELISLSKDADLLLIECSFPDHIKMRGHLSPNTIKKVSELSGAKQIILLHMYPICDKYDLLKGFKGSLKKRVKIGRDGMAIDLK